MLTLRSPATSRAEARQALDNIGAILKAGEMSPDDVVSVQVYLTDGAMFERMNAVLQVVLQRPTSNPGYCRRCQARRAGPNRDNRYSQEVEHGWAETGFVDCGLDAGATKPVSREFRRISPDRGCASRLVHGSFLFVTVTCDSFRETLRVVRFYPGFQMSHAHRSQQS